MKAVEARQLAISDDVVAEAREKLLEHIKRASRSGQVHVIVFGIRLEVSERALKDLGYTVASALLGTAVLVSWDVP